MTSMTLTITSLLSHYWTGDDPEPTRRMQLRDWIEDLAEFTSSQVQWAAREWRRTQSLRPTIADIRRLATHAQQNDLRKSAIDRSSSIDAETRRMWQEPEYQGDSRTPQRRRLDAIQRNEERYRRAAECRRATKPENRPEPSTDAHFR
jgi:hypothetical protein